MHKEAILLSYEDASEATSSFMGFPTPFDVRFEGN